MNVRAALLLAALVAAQASAQPPADEARAVVAALLAHQAAIRGPEGGAQTCIVPALAGPPAAVGADDPLMPDQAVRIGFQWHEPEPPARVRPARVRPEPGEQRGGRRPRRERIEPIPLPPPLPAELAARLDALRAGAATTSPVPIDASLVPAPLSLQGPDGNCAPLSLSMPAFAGDTAFVETAYACGTTCGNGSLYALRRREGAWTVIGVADIWIR